MRDADADHVPLLEARERYPGAAGFEHAFDDRPRVADRRGRHDVQDRER